MSKAEASIIYRYWGKAAKEGADGPPYHLLPYHCLDVAAVVVSKDRLIRYIMK